MNKLGIISIVLLCFAYSGQIYSMKSQPVISSAERTKILQDLFEQGKAYFFKKEYDNAEKVFLQMTRSIEYPLDTTHVLITTPIDTIEMNNVAMIYLFLAYIYIAQNKIGQAEWYLNALAKQAYNIPAQQEARKILAKLEENRRRIAAEGLTSLSTIQLTNTPKENT